MAATAFLASASEQYLPIVILCVFVSGSVGHHLTLGRAASEPQSDLVVCGECRRGESDDQSCNQQGPLYGDNIAPFPTGCFVKRRRRRARRDETEWELEPSPLAIWRGYLHSNSQPCNASPERTKRSPVPAAAGLRLVRPLQ